MRPKRERPERGQGFAEFALIFPIIMMVFFGMVEVGWWVQSWISVATAAREGARYGSRGLHVATSEIAEVSRVALSSTLTLDLEGDDANVRIIVTQIDIEADGTISVYSTYEVGALVVNSAVCLAEPCKHDQINIPSVSASNLAFNGNPSFCIEPAGCRSDLIVVEAFYRHRMLLPVPLITDYIDDHITINGRGIMRVLFRRDT